MNRSIFPYDSVELSPNGREVIVLDQTLLPNQEKFLHLTTPEQIFFAITLLKVQGAPAIGITGALGLAMCINRFKAKNIETLEKEFLRIKRYLYISRPAAANLMWSLDRMERCFYTTLSKIETDNNHAVDVVKNALIAEARSIKLEDAKMCQAISENGLKLLRPGCCVLTHGNSGHLSVSRYGTALGPIYLAQQMGYSPRVYVDETRPQLQGSRLAAYELMREDVDTTLICDNMAAFLMSQGKIDYVFVGCVRIAQNGDVANFIGTLQLAVTANYFNVPFYVLTPTNTIDFNCKSGQMMSIEDRPSYEVTDTFYNKPCSPKGINVYNPAIDITPASLIKGIVTEQGIFKPDEINRLG